MKEGNTVFETEWFSIDELPYDAGKSGRPFYRISCKDWVEILALTADNKIILVRQFRLALGTFTLELPSGYIDSGETPEEAVERELLEETGFVCSQVINIGALKALSSRINNTLWVFCGKEARLTGLKRKEDEETEVTLVTQDEFKEMVTNGEFVQATGLAAYFLCALNGCFDETWELPSNQVPRE